MIYDAPTWANNQAPAINAARLQTLCDAVEQDGIEIQTLQQQQANPYTYKGTVASTSALPGSGNTVNDTYYVESEECLYTWNGSAWSQSSVSGLDYQAELTQITTDIGTLSNLTTTDKSSLVGAVNEVDGNVGDLSSLTTTDKTSVVGAVNELATDVGEINDALVTKAEIDGLYEDMTVGNAEQLVSTIMVEDQEPYIFRTAGGSADVGNRAYIDSIVGGTVVWNQLVSPTVSDDGIIGWRTLASTGSLSVDEDGALVYTMSRGGASEYRRAFQSINIPAGHVARFSFEIMEVATDTASAPIDPLDIAYNIAPASYVQPFGDTPARHIFSFAEGGVWYAKEMLIQRTSDDKYVYFGTRSATTGKNIVLSLRNVVVQDLTLMFGPTIANYVYGLEQATPGAGVAWFKRLFPKAYYAYDPGSLQSVQAASHETVGFNAYDHSTGTARLLGGNQYQITGAYTALDYEDINGDAETITPDSNGLFTPVNNGTLTVTGGNGTTTCVHLTWSGYRNGEWDEYAKRSYSLDDSLTLRGIPKLDSANNLYYDGDAYEPDGTVTRRYKLVDLGTLTWRFVEDATFPYFYAYSGSGGAAKTEGALVIISDKYLGIPNVRAENFRETSLDKCITVNPQSTVSNRTIMVQDSAYTDEASFQAAMSGVYALFLTTSAYYVTETAEPYQSPQVVDDFGTEEYVDAAVQAGTRDVAIPVGHNTRYPANLRDKLQHLPELADDDGLYAISQTGTAMTLTEIPEAATNLPDAPTTDGTYTLQVTVADGTATYAWVAAT